jgi:rhodanese-related sulfurtransferase
MEQYLDFATRNWMLFALLGAVVVLIIANEVYRKLRGASSVTPLEALSLFNDQDAVMIDVREVGEFREGHLPNARNIALGSMEEKIKEMKVSKSRPIVVYCGTGNKASGAQSALKKNGFENVHLLAGGLHAWQSANLPTVKGRK